MKTIIGTLLLTCIISMHLNAQIEEIPFELKNGIILLKVNINDNTEARTFVFDTGATSDLLDSTTANTLGLKANYKENASGAGGTKSYEVILNQKLTLQNIIEIDSTHLVLTDLTKIKDKLERDFDGIIGYSLLKRYIAKIDYESQKILLYDKIENVDTIGYATIPFEFTNGIPIPQFDISITLNNGESFTDRILFDSGASLTLFINTPYNEKNKLSQKAGKSLISEFENLHDKSISEDIAIKSMNIGGFNLSEMVISIANDKYGVSSYKDYLGILGGKVISRFNLILDYSSSLLYLKPNNKFGESFEFPLSGIRLKKLDSGIIIDKIGKTSSAYEKGIRKGDKLISINKDSSGDLENYRELLQKEGENVSLVIINSEGKTEKITITLTRLL
ncbi:MAG: PDZ domain-containing protein [Maribacter sp.]|nr:PDZ domain-containing protein [Maribacter sp.]